MVCADRTTVRSEDVRPLDACCRDTTQRPPSHNYSEAPGLFVAVQTYCEMSSGTDNKVGILDLLLNP